MLTTHGIPHSGSTKILDYVENSHYQLACQKYFDITHGVRTPITHTPITHGVRTPITHGVRTPITHGVRTPITHITHGVRRNT